MKKALVFARTFYSDSVASRPFYLPGQIVKLLFIQVFKNSFHLRWGHSCLV